MERGLREELEGSLANLHCSMHQHEVDMERSREEVVLCRRDTTLQSEVRDNLEELFDR